MTMRVEDIDLQKQIKSRNEYRDKLKELQLDLLHYQRIILETRRSVILVFEGPDAAGKGGIIKRITERMDPRRIRVYSVVKPTTEEYQHHYMWRFWDKIPPYGHISIFDRSWYGRVLVERVEEFATEDQWKRAYREICEFERNLSDDGTLILKYYVHISKDEQLRRFKDRQADPYKHWKITDEDWRNRRKWDDYIKAANDMFEETSSKVAPWTLISGEYKWQARIEVLKHTVKAIRKEFNIKD